MALVLTRRIGETLVIGDNLVRVTVMGIERNQVKFALEADKEVSIHRLEIYEKIQAEKGELR